ncbi:hypothetical protein FJTKL_11686 [Diaporthe vaccinii]|uniref:non-specific serine/threonine protein kinase n=1 Tax=Diaporthe vaccinii TaxID=105482 RepID=A0ABR4EFL8_9PEZI
MSSSSSQSFGDIAFMLGCFEHIDTDEMLRWGEGINKKFIFKPPRHGRAWKGRFAQHFSIPRPVFAVPFGIQPKRASCWVLGSKTEEVDIQIARDNRNGVGKKCLSIDFVTYKEGRTVLRVMNESHSAPLYVEHGDSGANSISLAKGDQDEIEAPVRIHHPKFTFRIWTPTRDTFEEEVFLDHIQRMEHFAIDTALNYWPPLDSGLATPASDCRVSLEGQLYTKIPHMGIFSGGYGRVFMVKKVGKDSVALCAKELIHERSGLPGVAKRLDEETRDEYEKYSRFTHPHLATALDIAFMQDGSAPPWLILEHIPFGLADYICYPHGKEGTPWPQRPLPQLDPIDIMRQLFSLVSFFHDQGYVHRDLSPNNIRIYPDKHRWVIKVIDLGSLVSVTNIRAGVWGTPGFVAPEILEFQHYDEKVDIFCLGMIAFYLFTKVKHQWPSGIRERQAAFSPTNQARWMYNEAFPKLDKLDPKFTTLLGGLLARKAEKRWSAQKVLIYFWWLSDEADPNRRKRIASPTIFPGNKRRRGSNESTIRGHQAASAYPSSFTSFETAPEQSNGDLLSVPCTPFVEDVEAEPAEPASDTLDNWDFTIDMTGWLDPYSDPTNYTWLYTTNQQFAPDAESSLSASEAEIARDKQFGPSWVTGNGSESGNHTGCTQNIERLWDHTDSEVDAEHSSHSHDTWQNIGHVGYLGGRENTPLMGEASAMDMFASYSSDTTSTEPAVTTSTEPAVSGGWSLVDSCHGDRSWARRALDAWEGKRLNESFGAGPTFPPVQETNHSLPTPGPRKRARTKLI